MTTRSVHPSSVETSLTKTRRVEMAGLACLVAGLLGAAGGIYLALRTPLVGESKSSSDMRISKLSFVIPALLIRISTVPNSAKTASTKA